MSICLCLGAGTLHEPVHAGSLAGNVYMLEWAIYVLQHGRSPIVVMLACAHLTTVLWQEHPDL